MKALTNICKDMLHFGVFKKCMGVHIALRFFSRGLYPARFESPQSLSFFLKAEKTLNQRPIFPPSVYLLNIFQIAMELNILNLLVSINQYNFGANGGAPSSVSTSNLDEICAEL